MGTNYYGKIKPSKAQGRMIRTLWDEANVQVSNKNVKELEYIVESLKVEEKRLLIHIGKCSYGWQFLFNHNNWEYYKCTPESIDEFLNSCEYIVDEYGGKIPVPEFWEMVRSHMNGFDIESYSKDQIRKAKLKEAGKLEDKYNWIPTVKQAEAQYNMYKEHDFHEIIYHDSGLRFSDSTDFC
jgi:hypothetical protein